MAAALNYVFVLVTWHRRMHPGSPSANKCRLHSMNFRAHSVVLTFVVTQDEDDHDHGLTDLTGNMRRPDESTMAYLRLRSPKEKNIENERLKSPIGVYTGEPVPLKGPSTTYPVRMVATLVLFFVLTGLFVSGFLNEVAPSIFLAAPPIWLADLVVSNGRQGAIPDFPRVRTMFTNDLRYQDAGVTGDRAWRDMLPQGHGVVELRWPEHLKLPKKTHYVDQTGPSQKGIVLAEISVVKELDCLIKIRSALIGYDYDMVLSPGMKREVHACLDYVRQAVLCASDTTMEANRNTTSNQIGFSGEEMYRTERAAHTCRDWNSIRSWLELNRKGR